jgi:hypothetical protein
MIPQLSTSAGKLDFAGVVARLSDLSQRRPHDPFRDVPWDGPDSNIDRLDARWRFRRDEPLGSTAWYAALPADEQSRLGLEFVCQTLQFGIALESALSCGLLALVRRLPPRDPVFRYAMHEIIEESKHTLMFRTFVDRSGCTPAPIGRIDRWISTRIERSAARFPVLFFVWVLAGEIFVDADNRQRLEHRAQLHPVLERILQIHVTEEARHMRFAEAYLRQHWAGSSAGQRLQIQAMLPIIMSGSAAVMLRPSPALVKRFGIPRAALREAFGAGTPHRERLREIEAPVRALLQMRPRLSRRELQG